MGDTDEPDTDEPDTDEPDTDEPDTDEPDTDEPDTERRMRALVGAVAHALRVLRASRGLSQRELAEQAGVTKSAVARLESADPGPVVARWLGTVASLGLELSVCARCDEDARVAPPPHRDGGARWFPAHSFPERQSMPPTWWFVRHGGWGTKEREPEWFWRREPGFQPPSAASTTSLASACTCARCSGPRNDSA